MTRIPKITILSLAAASVFFVSLVLAQTGTVDTADIQYPVPKLGNCKNETECRTFCDKPANLAVCLDFAEEHDLMSDEELEMARKFLEAGGVGPGGCTSEDSCEAYCNDISHIDECISFAEENSMMPPDELEEAKKVQAAIKRGVQPPPCGNKKACDSYCEDPSHMEECITFAQEAGFLDDQELEEAQKVLQAIKRGAKPPPCRGKDACGEYCGQPDNMEACINFALEAGLMGEQEMEEAQKMLSAMKKGVKLPNCRGKAECDTYCQEDAHFDECMNFAEAAGFMDPKEAEMARKTRGKSPGGCKGKEACEAFCNDPANGEACFKFAEEHGLLSEDDIGKMKEGMTKMHEGLNMATPEVAECLRSTLGEETINKIKSGELMPGPGMGDAMRSCFEKFPPSQMGPPGTIPHGEEGGPPEGMPPSGMPQSYPPPGQGEFRGSGGCSTPEECQSYCVQNPEECQGFSGGPSGEHDEGFPVPQGQFTPPPGYENQPEPEGEPTSEGEFRPEGFQPPPGQYPPPDQFQQQYQEQYQQQIQQFQPPPENFAPPPPPPSDTEQPQSFLDSVYLGAIIRFLLGDY